MSSFCRTTASGLRERTSAREPARAGIPGSFFERMEDVRDQESDDASGPSDLSKLIRAREAAIALGQDAAEFSCEVRERSVALLDLWNMERAIRAGFSVNTTGALADFILDHSVDV